MAFGACSESVVDAFGLLQPAPRAVLMQGLWKQDAHTQPHRGPSLFPGQSPGSSHVHSHGYVFPE